MANDQKVTLTFKTSDNTELPVSFVVPGGKDGEAGAPGAAGATGAQGPQGETGAAGAAGVGITSITVTAEDVTA